MGSPQQKPASDILFWASMFSKAAELGMGSTDVWLFGLGAVLSTVLSLTIVTAAGSTVKAFLSVIAITVLNIAAGTALVFFGVKMAVQKAH